MSNKIAVLSANLSSFDSAVKHAPQSLEARFFTFADKNFPPRLKAMTPRLQAKIPKFFGWEYLPDYNYYLWLDGSISLATPDALNYFKKLCRGYDIVVFKHPVRPDIRQEVRFTRKGVKQLSRYFHGRYFNEFLKELYTLIKADKDYVDDLLVCGGVFIYRNTPAIRDMFKEWWYYNTRFILQDQISFPYVLKKSGVKYRVVEESIYDLPQLKIEKHKYHAK